MNEHLKSRTRSFRLALATIMGLACVVMICGGSACKEAKKMDTTTQPGEQPLTRTLHVGARDTYTVPVHGSVGSDATFATSDPAVVRIVETTIRYLHPENMAPGMTGGDAAEKTVIFEGVAPGEATVKVNKNFRGQLKEAVEIKVTVVK